MPNFSHFRNQEGGTQSKLQLSLNSWTSYQLQHISGIYPSAKKPRIKMALRRALGWSEGEVMRPESKPCSRLMRHTAGIFSVGGGLAFWVLCRLHYGQCSYPSCYLLTAFCLTPAVVLFLLGVRTHTTLLRLCLFCRSKNNCSKESQVGVMRSSLDERDISLACAAL